MPPPTSAIPSPTGLRILMLTPQSPWPPRQGTAVRNWHLAQQLAQRHRLTVLAFGEPGAESALRERGMEALFVQPPPRRSLRRRALELFTSFEPDLVRRLRSTAMLGRVLQTLGAAQESGDPFAVVQVEGLEMALYGQAVRHWSRHERHRPRLVYDAHNVEWLLQQRAWEADRRRPSGWPGALYSLVQTRKLRRYEAHFLAQVDGVVAVSSKDQAALQALAPHQRIVEVPNGVDTEFYRPADVNAEVPNRCLFVGKMDFRPNIDAMVWFVGAIWPHIRAASPAAQLHIVGRDPTPRVRALASDGVVVTGEVADVRPEMAEAAVVVVPLRVGGGTRLKILEAMAMGKAIVATSLAAEGLAVTAGQELVLVDDPISFARAVVDLLAQPAARHALGHQARHRVEECYRWTLLVPRIEALYH